MEKQSPEQTRATSGVHGLTSMKQHTTHAAVNDTHGPEGTWWWLWRQRRARWCVKCIFIWFQVQSTCAATGNKEASLTPCLVSQKSFWIEECQVKVQNEEF